MKPLNIPVVGIGPGFHPQEDPPNVLDIPREMNVFVMPQVPQTDDRVHFAEARGVIRRLVESLGVYRPGTYPHPRIEITHLDPASVELINQMLIEGEVSAMLATPEGRIKIQETNFAGVWRLLHYDASGALIHDYLEACPVPEVILQVAESTSADAVEAPPAPPGVMNSPTVLFEIQEQARNYRPGDPPHVVNLTLLPMSPEDHEYLNRALPAGPIVILSRGYGRCRIGTTALRHVWRVHYFNNMSTLILNTIEVVDIPEVTKAAPEDIGDSLERLRELLDWMERE